MAPSVLSSGLGTLGVKANPARAIGSATRGTRPELTASRNLAKRARRFPVENQKVIFGSTESWVCPRAMRFETVLRSFVSKVLLSIDNSNGNNQNLFYVGRCLSPTRRLPAVPQFLPSCSPEEFSLAL